MPRLRMQRCPTCEGECTVPVDGGPARTACKRCGGHGEVEVARVTVTRRRHVTRDSGGVEVSFDEENEFVGDVEDLGDDDAVVTLVSVDGVPARGLSRQQRSDAEEVLWFAYLDEVEAEQQAQGVQP